MLRSAWPLTQAHLSHLLLYTNPALMDSHVKTRELNRVGQGSREIRKGKAVSSLPVIQASPRSLLQQLRMSTVITRPLPSAPALCFPSKCQPIWPLLDSALPKRCYLCLLSGPRASLYFGSSSSWPMEVTPGPLLAKPASPDPSKWEGEEVRHYG